MRRATTKATLALTALCLAVAVFLPATATAAPAPAWTLTATPMPANFAPGASAQYLLVATNVGAAPMTGDPAVIETTLPAGLEPLAVSGVIHDFEAIDDTPTCSIVVQTVKCETTEVLHQGRWLQAKVNFKVSAPEGPIDTTATVSGGGATNTVSVTGHAVVQPNPVDFGFLTFEAPLTQEDGTPTTLAGSHPYQQTIDFGFPTKNPGDGLTNSGHPRTLHVDLPRGLLGNPAATPDLCTEAELTSITSPGCPDESQIGITDTTSLLGDVNGAAILSSNLYNMVPPPGAVAEIATDIGNTGIFVHLLISVRSDGDYGIEATVNDILAFGNQPIFNSHAQVWGDPSSPAHERIRGGCIEGAGLCPVDRQDTALLSLPTDCATQPLSFELAADTWEQPSPPNPLLRAQYDNASIAGAPSLVSDCDQISYEPEITVAPTTNLTDSPSGLDVTVHQPQDTSLAGRSTSALKDATITLPKGLAVNPAQAWGLDACSEGEIGFRGNEGGQPRFSKDPQSCPGAAKIGTVEVTSPALVRRDAEHEVEVQPGGGPVLDPVHGSLYIAEPFANPFDTLIAVYLVIEDKAKGLVAKLAGKGELDPQSGQITTRFTETPELPIEDFRAHIFGGARGAFVTPPTCGPYTTATEMVPWSAPQGKSANPQDAFNTTASPRGGACPTTESQLPNATALDAGTLNPIAAKYSPLLFKLSREDATQRLGKIEATLPTGLIAKLAGVASCSEADIAKARSREVPERGAAEQADPSCPAGSEIGTVEAAAGAGPTPYRTTGHAYLAGPYKGAPVSIVAIAAAVAGPFDLGTVVVRSALYLDPTTAQARVVSDPLPTILQGVPLDVRSVAVRSDRPNFTLNPTSCAEKSFGGTTLSTLAAPAALFERFQVGGCKSLPYKPQLGVRLFGPIHRGGHPRLKAVFTAKPGEANTKAISFAFPKSEFIDQAHFRTICTRVQFAANQCPAGAIYGYVRAFSPLLDYPLEGPAYLRSSNHKLPDLVLALRGPAHQPIALDAVGRVDSINGGLRVRFEEVPDAPISKVIVTAQGNKKGLFQNSTNICKGTHRATLKLDAQNGKVHDIKPKLRAQCGKGGKGKKKTKAGGP
jgi:hypothetical protein